TRLEGAVSAAAASCVSLKGDPAMRPPATTAPPTAVVVAMNVRRVGVVGDSPESPGGGTSDSVSSVGGIRTLSNRWMGHLACTSAKPHNSRDVVTTGHEGILHPLNGPRSVTRGSLASSTPPLGGRVFSLDETVPPLAPAIRFFIFINALHGSLPVNFLWRPPGNEPEQQPSPSPGTA
ncbi:hypothetical protein STRIP9103_00111, partial [Streptomyces ipomoeae 91-03]